MLPCNEKVIKNKAGLLNLAEELNNVPRAYKVMGFSRDTFYRYKTVVEEGGVDALFDKSRTQDVYKRQRDLSAAFARAIQALLLKPF